MKTKEELRSQMREILLNQSRGDRDSRSRKIAEKVFGFLPFEKANNIHFYMSMPSEVDTGFLIDRALSIGKRVVLPRTDFENKELHWYEIRNRSRDLKRGTLGIFEPDPTVARKFTEDVACVFVPGVVFDKKNNRVGRGLGFYDRYLARLSPNVIKMGLAFSFQVLPEVPTDKHDVRLDEVITD